MQPKSKKNREDKLAKQRLCQRRRYREINDDPELLAVEKEKRRQKYLKKKTEKKPEKSPRAIKEQRKRWRENTKRYRQKKKEVKQPTFEAIQIQAATCEEGASTSLDTNIEKEDPLKVNSAAKLLAINKVKYEEKKKRKRLLRLLLSYKKKNRAQAKKIQRLRQLLKDSREMNKTNSSNTDSLELPTNTSADTKNDTNQSEISSKSKKLSVIETITKFYLQDANSVLCSGKKQYITKNKMQMQKRFLCLPLKDLHKKFLDETKIKVSYSFFCKLRPFWVTFPKESNRDTCVCQIHENMNLLIQGLHKMSIIREKNYDQVLSKLCCDSKNIDCLNRTCDACKSNRLEYCVDSGNSPCTFNEWKRVSKEISLPNNVKRKRIVTEKKEITTSTKDAINKLEDDLKNFFHHSFKIMSQYNAIRNLKENLNIHEACVHIDFSENYSLKYGAEVQAFHFGASRQQVSLHTAVIYTHSFTTGKVTPKSMCTISECLRHDAPAVWAHLMPLIQEVFNLNPFIDTLHFLSDSPTSQYRNKYIFFLIGQLYKDFPLKKVTWNYSESGHGKGAPDGVGATLKRTADRMVTFGKDIGTFQQFYDLIKSYIENDNIIVKKIDTKDILLKENLIPKTLKPFRGTFSVYQVLWEKSSSSTTLRNMSCFDCEASEICIHGKHIDSIENVMGSQDENIPSCDPDKAKQNRIVILNDITFKAINVPIPSISSQFK